MLALHFAPVRSEDAGPEPTNTLFFCAGNLADGQRHAGIRHVDDHVDLVDVKPLIGDLRADVGLVLVVGADHLDLDVGMILHEVLRRELRRGNRARAGIVGIKARHVGQHADLDVHLLRTCDIDA